MTSLSLELLARSQTTQWTKQLKEELSYAAILSVKPNLRSPFASFSHRFRAALWKSAHDFSPKPCHVLLRFRHLVRP